jgi:hypothetical protein
MFRSSARRTMALLFALLGFLVSSAVGAPAATRESKVFVYVVYNAGNRAQKSYAQALLKKFNQLGFTERLKKKGVNWVEANYSSASAAAAYLHIGADDVVYFGILMADSSDRMTREMYRAHIPVTPNMNPRQIQALADETAHEFYFALVDVVDNFHDKSRWARQNALLDWRDMKAGQVRIMLDGKDIAANKNLFVQPPFKRQNIHLVMVPFSPALFKRLGADAAGTSRQGGREVLWVKKGKQRLIFEVGPQITDIKTYAVSYAGGVDKKFISPIKTLFAYPEPHGNVTFVPLNLVIKTLYLPYDVEDDGMTETLTPKK